MLKINIKIRKICVFNYMFDDSQMMTHEFGKRHQCKPPIRKYKNLLFRFYTQRNYWGCIPMLKAPKHPPSMYVLALNTQCYTQAYYFVTNTHSLFHTHFHIPIFSLLNSFSLCLCFFPPFLFFKFLVKWWLAPIL